MKSPKSLGDQSRNKFDPHAPIPESDVSLFVSEGERAALSRTCEYSRKKQLPKAVLVTRQQLIEDVLSRGFERVEIQKRGRSLRALRLHSDSTGAFYDFQSTLEIEYVLRRHGVLFGKRVEAEPTPAEVPPQAPAHTEALERADAPQPKVDDIATPHAWTDAAGDWWKRRLTDGQKPEQIADSIVMRAHAARGRGMTDSEVGALFAALLDPAGGKAVWATFSAGDATMPANPTRVEIESFVRNFVGQEPWLGYLRARNVVAVRSVQRAREREASMGKITDFHYERGTTIIPEGYGRVSRITGNIAAIKLLNELDEEDREPTAEEMLVLSRYNGWGADKEVLNREQVHELTQRKQADGAGWLEKLRREAEEEKAELARYSWRSKFTPVGDFLGWYETYGKYTEQVLELLTPEEFATAAESILSAFYTEEGVCHFLWDVARKAGFRGGRVIEPAVGSGRILGAMPPDLRAASRVEAVEKDQFSARLVRRLFPRTKVHAMPFEDSPTPAGGYDLVISNVPFSETGPGIQDGLGDVDFNLHNYFVAESMRKLKPGGLAVLITSASTMENNDTQRHALAKLGELWGAVRLPSDAFKTVANTDVVTDVLLLRRPTTEMIDGPQAWAAKLDAPLAVPFPKEETEREKAARIAQGNNNPPMHTTVEVNEYFVSHPDHVLGEHRLDGSMYGRKDGQYTCVSRADAPVLTERLAAALATLPGDIPNPSLAAHAVSGNGELLADESRRGEMDHSDIVTPEFARYGALLEVAGIFYIAKQTGDRMNPLLFQSGGKLPEGIRTAAEAKELLSDYLVLRDRLESLVATDNAVPEGDGRSDEARESLKRTYDSIVERYKSLSNFGRKVKLLIPHEPMIGSVVSLETVRETPPAKVGGRPVRTFHPAAILETRTIYPRVIPDRADTLEDAVAISLGQTGGVDVDYVARLLRRDIETPESREALVALMVDGGHAFRDPQKDGAVIAADRYLSGDVVTKLAQARRAAEIDAALLANVKALEAIQPARATWETIRAPFGAQFIPPGVIVRFLNEAIGSRIGPEGIVYDPETAQFIVGDSYMASAVAETRYAASEFSVNDCVTHALAQTSPRITYKTEDGATILDEKATTDAKGCVEALCTEWRAWCERNADAREEILRGFDDRYNRYVTFTPRHEHLKFPGLNPKFVPRDHQRAAVAKLMAEPSGVIAYGVGFGKTAVGILGAVETVRIGSAKKPMIVCDSANYLQFVEAMRDLYPGKRLLVADDANFNPQEREAFKAAVAFGSFDCVLMSRTQFEKIPVSAKLEAEFTTEELAKLMRARINMRGSGRATKSAARKLEKAIEKKKEKLKSLHNERAGKADRGICFDDLGVDLLIVDESHRHKKIGIETRHRGIKGIDSGRSARAFDLLIKARFIQNRRDGQGVVGLTGTPCTNTMAEFHTAISIFAPKVADLFGVEHFDAFMSAFCQTRESLAMKEATGQWVMEKRLDKFVNGPAFIRFVRSGMLIEMDSRKVKLDVPKHAKGDIELEVVPLNEQTLGAMERLSELNARYEEHKSKELSWVPLVLMQMGIAASIDPRLIDPKQPIAPDGVLARVANNVAEIYKEKPGCAQVVFLDRYGDMDTSILRKLEENKADEVRIVVEEEPEEVADVADDDAPEEPEILEAEAKTGGGRKRLINLYEDLRAQLIASGVPAERILCVNDVAKKDRAAMFERVNRGEVSVIMGSSDKLGIGANFQRNLYAAHHFDPARNMTPDQMEQRNGRILRQGNANKEVRVIYYGMEDTCCPAIYGRIQRKAEFIKQGYAERGVGVEFEDVSEVRMEEMKAALIPDKRAFKLAELKAALADELRVTETAQRYQGRVSGDLEHEKRTLAYFTGPSAARAMARKNWLSENTTPVPDGDDANESAVMEVDVSGLTSVTNDLTAWIKEHGPVLRGTAKEVTKHLGKLVAAQKDFVLNGSELGRSLGTIKINGMPVRLKKAQVTFATSGRESEECVASVPDPAEPTKPVVKETCYGSGEMLLKVVRQAAFMIEADVRDNSLRIRTTEERIQALEGEVRLFKPIDFSSETKLRAEIRAVEADMAAKPYVRGSRLRELRAKAGMGESPALPKTAEPSRRAAIPV